MRPLLLVILDGWGLSREVPYNAITNAYTEDIKRFFIEYGMKAICAHAECVGLPPHTAGNSEVGHITIGAGEIIPQPLTLMNRAFASKEAESAIVSTFAHTQRIHILTLISDGNVHSSIDHLHQAIDILKKQGKEVLIHAFLDGRDTPPKSALSYLNTINKKLIGSVTGRFYAMDRHYDWQHTNITVAMLCGGKAVKSTIDTILHSFYQKDITDEFIPPTLLREDARLQENDGLLFLNFRSDRIRQLAAQLTRTTIESSQQIIDYVPQFKSVLCACPYHPKITAPTIFVPVTPQETLYDVLEKYKLRLFTIAETQKYPHVTYFFNGGREIQRTNEIRVLVPSKPVANFAECPAMSAEEITNTILKALRENKADFYLINYANADMVGHSGDFLATVKAINTLNEQIKRLLQERQKIDFEIIITSDHGNAEVMWDDATDQPWTGHTCNPVPFSSSIENFSSRSVLQLADIKDYVIDYYSLYLPTE